MSSAAYTLEVTAGNGTYAPVTIASTFFTGYVTAKSGNAGTVSFKDPFGNVTVLIATEFFQLSGVDLSTCQVSGSQASQIVKFQGSIYQNP